MSINSKQLAKVLFELLQEYPKEEKKIMDDFLLYIEEKNLLGLLPGLIKNLENLKLKVEVSKKIKLILHHKVTVKTIGDIKNFIGENKAEVEIILEKEMIGGFKVEYKNKIYDGSVMTQLEQARRKLINSN